MPKSANEPTNIILEQLRVMRAETKAQLDDVKADMATMGADIAAIKTDVRGLKLNVIAEVYKANLSVASFLDHERRLRALEEKAS